MKHLLLCSLLLAGAWLRPVRAQAQPTGSDSLSQKLTNIFAPLDKSQVPTGYLYEAGVRFLEPRYYNGQLSDSNRTDMDVLRHLRAQMRSSRVYGTDTLPTLPAFNARLKAAAATPLDTTGAAAPIPLAIQYLPYASIKPNALQDNLLTVQNEQVHDVPGRAQNPYQVNVLFAAAPVRTYSRTNAVSFLFRRNLYLTSNGAKPKNLYLDFGDGRGYQPATWDQPLATTYATAGTKRVKVKVVFDTRVLAAASTQSGASTQAQAPAPGGTVTYESHFDFQVQSVVAAARYDNAYGFTRNILLSFSGSFPTTGARVSVRYGRGHGAHVVKPFIVVEQYNIAGAAPNLIKCNNANNDVENFLPRIGPLFTGIFDFDNQLEAEGYDLIYIDFLRNTDDITRNAQVLEKVIQEVNAWKASSQSQGLTTYSNVVMGMSMGGLVARYGLAEMTKNPGPYGSPDTRLLVLHDSPQRGAYNPVGLQSFARSTDVPLNIVEFLKLRDLDGRLDDAVNVLNEPATQQLAILTAFNGRGDIRPNTFIDGVYKDMTDFTLPANAGGPQPGYGIVATSDGSQCGTGSGAPLGVTLSSVDTYTSRWLAPLAYLPGFSLGVRGGAYGLPAYGQRAIISRMRVYIEYRITIGFGFFKAVIPIRYNLLNESATSPANTLPYETLPGGTTNLDRESGECGSATDIAALFLRTGLYNGDICFVPTYSAMEVPAVTLATAFAKYLNNMTDNPSKPRVLRYVAQANPNAIAAGYNLNHLTFTPRNSEWIFNEMQRPFNGNANPVACQPLALTECTLTPIVGSVTNLCGTGTLSVQGVAAGAAVTWASSNSAVATIDANTGVATRVGTGSVTFTATVTGDGCSQQYSTMVPVGPDLANGTYAVYTGGGGGGASGTLQPWYSGDNEVDGEQVSIYFPIGPNETYSFVPDSPSPHSFYPFGANQLYIVFNTPTAGYYQVGFTATKTTAACGSASEYFVVGYYYTPSYSFNAAPNPSSSELTVTKTASSSPAAAPASRTAVSDPPFRAVLYDGRGLQVKDQMSSQDKVVFDVHDLPPMACTTCASARAKRPS